MVDMFKIILSINILSSIYSAHDCRNSIEVKLTYFENPDFCVNSVINVCEISLRRSSVLEKATLTTDVNYNKASTFVLCFYCISLNFPSPHSLA